MRICTSAQPHETPATALKRYSEHVKVVGLQNLNTNALATAKVVIISLASGLRLPLMSNKRLHYEISANGIHAKRLEAESSSILSVSHFRRRNQRGCGMHRNVQS